ncbi:hypothetical protein AALD01_15715 [Oscillospiraceae bacterium 21-37]
MNFPKENARLIKQDASVIDNIAAFFDNGTIFIDDASICIEDGDTFERTLLNGIKERYLVLDSGFFNGSPTIPAHYQVKVEKKTPYRKATSGQVLDSPSVNDARGININVSGGSISNLQIQQGSVNSSQVIAPSQDFDYKAVSDFLNRISKYPMLTDELGEKSVEFEQLVAEAEDAIENKASPSKIKAVLNTMKDLMVGITGSLIASGIATQIPALLVHLGL